MTMKEIAQLAGVSKATVSRVINNSQNVSPSLRKKVDKVLKETGYTPNLLAQELATKQTKLIGIILPRIGVDVFSKIVEGISAELKKEGYNIILASSKEQIEEEFNYFDIFQKKQVDGIIFFPYKITEEHVDFLNKVDTPLVIMGREVSRIRASYITYDDYYSSKEIVNHLIANGHKKIAYIGLEDDISVQNLRKDGYCDALIENKIDIKEEYITTGNFEMNSGYDAMEKLLKLEDKPTAVFSVLDGMAYGAMRCIADKGLRVPEDISVAGIDDMETSALYIPRLTTINFDYAFSGSCAGKLILEKINNKNSMNKRIVISYNIKIRESVINISKK